LPSPKQPPELVDVFKPLKTLPKPFPSAEADLSLVDWRWARARGFYDPSTKRWDESKGGLEAYLVDVWRRKGAKRSEDWATWNCEEGQGASKRKAAPSKSKRVRRGSAFAGARFSLEGGEGVVESALAGERGGDEPIPDPDMNLDGLEPIDLFFGGNGDKYNLFTFFK
jgi:hypothetical protein